MFLDECGVSTDLLRRYGRSPPRDQVLVPTLRPGDVVVLDHLAVHKQPEIRVAIEAAQARVYFLPPYSPDFNPIEQVFAKLKAFLRAARPRSFDQVCELMATALTLFTPTECAKYMRDTPAIASLHQNEKRSRARITAAIGRMAAMADEDAI